MSTLSMQKTVFFINGFAAFILANPLLALEHVPIIRRLPRPDSCCRSLLPVNGEAVTIGGLLLVRVLLQCWTTVNGLSTLWSVSESVLLLRIGVETVCAQVLGGGRVSWFRFCFAPIAELA